MNPKGIYNLLTRVFTEEEYDCYHQYNDMVKKEGSKLPGLESGLDHFLAA